VSAWSPPAHRIQLDEKFPDILIQTDLCEEPALPLTVKQALYGIAQEALQNTIKHAYASRVDLILRRTDSVVSWKYVTMGLGLIR
jgi:signal transduction histidine kinase